MLEEARLWLEDDGEEEEIEGRKEKYAAEMMWPSSCAVLLC
jgi:hypothetical protein